MKLGPVLTYKDVNLTVRLIGKRCKFSNVLSEIERGNGISAILFDAELYNDHPFVFNLPGGKERYQFIREVIEDEPEGQQYKPYDLSDKNVRDSLRGRWFRDEYGNELFVRDFYCFKDGSVWYVNGYSPKDFLEKCKWLDDGTPCGRRVE